jgi:hypothetical protein
VLLERTLPPASNASWWVVRCGGACGTASNGELFVIRQPYCPEHPRRPEDKEYTFNLRQQYPANVANDTDPWIELEMELELVFH